MMWVSLQVLHTGFLLVIVDPYNILGEQRGQGHEIMHE
jgi:hypothetical protein